MITVWNARQNRTHLSALAYPADERPLRLGEMVCWLASFVKYRILTRGCKSKRILFLTERRGNVIENKAPLWKTWRRSGNPYENTGA
jgi:hypothetical protein